MYAAACIVVQRCGRDRGEQNFMYDVLQFTSCNTILMYPAEACCPDQWADDGTAPVVRVCPNPRGGTARGRRPAAARAAAPAVVGGAVGA